MNRHESRLLEHINALWQNKECLRCHETTWALYFGPTLRTRVANADTGATEPARLMMAHLVCQYCGLTESINLDVVNSQRRLALRLLND